MEFNFFAIRCILTTSFLEFSRDSAGGVCFPLPVLIFESCANKSARYKVSINSSLVSTNSISSSTKSESRNALKDFSIWDRGDDVSNLPSWTRTMSPPLVFSAHSSVDQFFSRSSIALETCLNWSLAESTVTAPAAFAWRGNNVAAAAVVPMICKNCRRWDVWSRLLSVGPPLFGWENSSVDVVGVALANNLGRQILLLCHAATPWK